MVLRNGDVLYEEEELFIPVLEACEKAQKDGGQYLFIYDRWGGPYAKPVKDRASLAELFGKHRGLEGVGVYDLQEDPPRKLHAPAVREDMKTEQMDGHLPQELRF